MATAKSDVELAIRARNEASKALRNVSSAIQDLVSGQKELAESANSTESQLGQLDSELQSLRGNIQALRETKRVASDLRRVSEQLEKQQQKVSETAERYEKLKLAYEQAERPTKRMAQQLQSAEKALETNRAKAGELEARVGELRQRYQQTSSAAGALGASEEELAQQTTRATAEFAELQTRLREVRNLSKNAVQPLGEVDPRSFEALREEMTRVSTAVREAGESSDLTQVDLKALKAEVDNLEASLKDLGQLRDLTAAYQEMRVESRKLLRAWQESEERTKELARQFKAAEEPSRELGEALGKSRAETSRLANDYRQASANVQQLGEALRTAGVDTRRAAQSQSQIQKQMESTAEAVASNRVALDQLSDAQRVALREQKEAAAAAEREEQARQAAAEASATAQRVYEQAGAAVDEARQAYQRATEQLNRIRQAAEAAGADLAELRQEQAQASQRVEESVAAYREAEQRLSGLAQQIQATSAPSRELVESFEASEQELKRLKAEVAEAKEGLEDATSATKKAESQYQSLNRLLEKASDRQEQLASNARQVEQAYKSLGETLADNAADAQTISAAQRDLESSLDRSGSKLQQFGKQAATAESRLEELQQSGDDVSRTLREAGRVASRSAGGYDQLSQTVRSARSSLQDFDDQGRTTLSLMQRIRGQVLALASAYVGLYGVGSSMRSIIEANRQLEATQAQLQVAAGETATGSSQAVAEELEFVEQVAEDLRLDLGALTRSYGRFSIAARKSGATVEETRAVFLGLSKAARVNKLSSDELARATKALEQIFSQGKVQAEELREQLADAGLAGTLGMLQDALGVTGEELNKLLEEGRVSSKALIPFAKELEETYGAGLSQALQSTSAEIADFQSQLFKVQLTIGRSGFLESFAEALRRVNEQLDTPEAQQNLERLGAASGQLMQTLAHLVENLDEVVLALKLLGSVLGARYFLVFIARTAQAAQALSTFRARSRAATATVRALGAATSVFFAALAGYSIAEWAAQEFPTFGRYWRDFKGVILAGIAEMRASWERLKVAIDAAMDFNLRDAGIGAIDQVIDTLGLPKRLAEQVKGESIESVGGWYEGLQKRLDELRSESTRKELNRIDRELEARKKAIRERMRAEQEAAERGSSLEPVQYQPGGVGDILSIEKVLGDQLYDRSDFILSKEESDEIAKRMERSLEQAQERLAEMSAETLEERLQLIRSEYDDLLKYLREQGKTGAVQDVEQLIALRQEQERIRFNKERQQELDSRVNKLTQTRRDILKQIEILEKQSGQSDEVQRLKGELEGVNSELDKAIRKAIEFAESMGNDAAVQRLNRLQVEMNNTQDETKEGLIDMEAAANRFASSAANAFDSAAKATYQWLAGIKEGQEAWESVRDAFLKFAADFLRYIAKMIMQQAILNAMRNAGILSGGAAHTGGIAGRLGDQRSMPAYWFDSAVRYHNGGVAGLKPNEVPAVLERGEEVITKNDPRHAANGGASGKDGVKIVNTFDAGEMVSAGLNTPAGEKVIMNFMSRNSRKIKSTLG